MLSSDMDVISECTSGIVLGAIPATFSNSENTMGWVSSKLERA